MTYLLNAIWETLLAFGDWYIIWLKGPDGILFDAISIIKLIGSAGVILGGIVKLIRKSWYI